MAIKPIRYDSGLVLRLPLAASAAVTKHQLVKYASGYITDAASGDAEVEYVTLEAKTDATASNGGTFVDVLPITDSVQFEVLCSTTPVQATHVGNDYDVSDANTIDLAASTDNVFHIDQIASATDNTVIGRFNKPAIA
jgi:hypothetical protein